MRILLANDDGVMAPGIKALRVALEPKHAVTTIAPSEERSTTGHSLSLDKPLRLEKLEERVYACSGFPADCVQIALGHVMKHARPELVISGINRGANLGQDLYYSGTVAAAREAAFHDVPSLAVSLVFQDVTHPHLYETAARIISYCVELEIHKVIPPRTLININVPNLSLKEVKGAKLSETGFRRYSEEIHVRMDTRGREYFWIGGLYQGHDPYPQSDCETVALGFVAITPHRLIDGLNVDWSGLASVVEKLNAKILS
jgi:5'-nucleotidase